MERGCLNHFVNGHVLLFHVLAGLDEYHERGHRDSGHKINQLVPLKDDDRKDQQDVEGGENESHAAPLAQ